MTDAERLEKIREIAYTIVGPQEDEIKRAQLYFSQISDPDIKREAQGYFEMIAMASLLEPASS